MTKYTANYICNYCKYKHNKIIIKGLGKGKKHNYSSMVKCPRCDNFAKTWDDAINLKEVLTK